MGERFDAIAAGLKKALHLQDVHKEVMAKKESMPAKPAMQEKPAGVVEITNEEANEAEKLAEAGYKENNEEQKAA